MNLIYLGAWVIAVMVVLKTVHWVHQDHSKDDWKDY